jgi:hypothetical protein
MNLSVSLTLKFILLAIAFAYGAIVVSAAPVRESSLVARSAAYEDFNARGIDDIELFVRQPFIKKLLRKFGIGKKEGFTRLPSPDPNERHFSLQDQMDHLKRNPKTLEIALSNHDHPLRKAAEELERQRKHLEDIHGVA